HRVSILRVGKAAAPDQQEIAKEHGVDLVGHPCPIWRGFWMDDSGLLERYLCTLRPEIAHLQYVRVPKYHYISHLLLKTGVPYVVSLHGGMNSTEMTRHYFRKKLYWHFLE